MNDLNIPHSETPLSLIATTELLRKARLWMEEQILNYQAEPETQIENLQLARRRFVTIINELTDDKHAIGHLSKNDDLVNYSTQDILEAIEEIAACLTLTFKSRMWAYMEMEDVLSLIGRLETAHLTNRIEELSIILKRRLTESA